MNKELYCSGNTITLDELLKIRDNRDANQRRLLKKYNRTLISFTLNIVGPQKRFLLADMVFESGLAKIQNRLKILNCKAIAEEVCETKAGMEGYFVVDMPGEELKKIVCALENETEIGRLYDIDIISPNGVKISREDIGEKRRRCLLCNETAAVCARSQAHTLDAVFCRTKEIMVNFIGEEFSERVSQAALKALLYEVAVTPKPGLVDRQNSGAHNDMDIFLFLDSATALLPYFKKITKMGFLSEESGKTLLSKIRPLGMQAEDEMFCATGNVNTHKGAIFSLGLLAAAAGLLQGKGEQLTPDNILSCAGEIATGSLSDFNVDTKSHTQTNGIFLYKKNGFLGIRGEAARGFPSVRNIAYPMMKNCLSRGLLLNDAGVAVLIKLMSEVDDSNVIKRGGDEALALVHQWTKAIMLKINADESNWLDEVRDLDKLLIERNISSGGSADLLGVSYFLLFLFEHC